MINIFGTRTRTLMLIMKTKVKNLKSKKVKKSKKSKKGKDMLPKLKVSVFRTENTEIRTGIFRTNQNRTIDHQIQIQEVQLNPPATPPPHGHSPLLHKHCKIKVLSTLKTKMCLFKHKKIHKIVQNTPFKQNFERSFLQL